MQKASNFDLKKYLKYFLVSFVLIISCNHDMPVDSVKIEIKAMLVYQTIKQCPNDHPGNTDVAPVPGGIPFYIRDPRLIAHKLIIPYQCNGCMEWFNFGPENFTLCNTNDPSKKSVGYVALGPDKIHPEYPYGYHKVDSGGKCDTCNESYCDDYDGEEYKFEDHHWEEISSEYLYNEIEHTFITHYKSTCTGTRFACNKKKIVSISDFHATMENLKKRSFIPKNTKEHIVHSEYHCPICNNDFTSDYAIAHLPEKANEHFERIMSGSSHFIRTTSECLDCKTNLIISDSGLHSLTESQTVDFNSVGTAGHVKTTISKCNECDWVGNVSGDIIPHRVNGQVYSYTQYNVQSHKKIVIIKCLDCGDVFSNNDAIEDHAFTTKKIGAKYDSANHTALFESTCNNCKFIKNSEQSKPHDSTEITTVKTGPFNNGSDHKYIFTSTYSCGYKSIGEQSAAHSLTTTKTGPINTGSSHKYVYTSTCACGYKSVGEQSSSHSEGAISVTYSSISSTQHVCKTRSYCTICQASIKNSDAYGSHFAVAPKWCIYCDK